MKKRKVYVKTISLDVMTIDQDLREDYDLNPSAEMIMERVSDEVSPQLYGMLIQQLLGFHADMQVEMAEDLEDFAVAHIAHTTGCASVDYVLNICYGWIAAEHGLFQESSEE